ncbi:carbamoyl phosphate synthase small subunit [Pullulanibacillus sp. KACC 23026]|uniref:carbamoyl phosphate synthase small subunit n=1 Tax=Pullulanibacillus sp. KACC 23026 TaxID=3028315 RepID=UPI0023AF1815|nr:carbamoyl phosphate synthase small subunit [Pullulanibacillus sp. KACC 23026]WEG13067.1 carbamoyl phosphate synthase small subunit [Pullulanibacillus sp. KACC 23026]
MKKGYLVLESGDLFEGTHVGQHTHTTGEVVFNTGMTGYQEMLTDPSYAGQILTFCYPLIGNYGVNKQDDEGPALHLSGVVLSHLATQPSHYLSTKTFLKHMNDSGIPVLADVDTRAVVKKIRHAGTMRGVLTLNPDDVSFTPKLQGLDLIKKVSSEKVEHYKGSGPHVVLINYGSKKSILTALLHAGCEVTVVPYHITFNELKSLKPTGVVLSNGPGNPMALKPYFNEIKKISETYPTLGICLGHQLIALAHGAETEKLLFGHRGGNHPVKELETGKVWMTSQNHSFVVKEASIDTTKFEVSYRNVNDKSVEGLKAKHLPIETVQFHPEAHPGPTDTEHIFDRFIHKIKHAGESSYAITY